jgi:hypothetical protein
MTKEVSEHIQRRRIVRASAALPVWAAAEFTERKAAVMRVVGVEMANNRGVCALHIKAIAAAAGVSVETARGALRTAKMIGLVTVEHLQGFYDIRSRTPTWLAALRELQEASSLSSERRQGNAQVVSGQTIVENLCADLDEAGHTAVHGYGVGANACARRRA